MKVLGGPLVGFGDFELNIADITMHSDNEQNIMLPYHGSLSPEIANIQHAHIYINVQLMQDAKIVLIFNRIGERPIRRPVSASVSEIRTILDQFFDQDDTGLSPYGAGLWQGDYITWRQIMEDPSRLAGAIRTMTTAQRIKLREILDATA